jgi:hypothetical protein
LKFYRLRSEAYFRPSEIFVNGRDCWVEVGLYPVEKENVGGMGSRRDADQQAVSAAALWKS